MNVTRPLTVELRIDGSPTTIALGGDCPATTSTDPDAMQPVDLTVVRTASVHAGDLNASLPAGEVADGTYLITRSGEHLRCWGLPASSNIDLELEEAFTLRLHLTNSPFTYRTVHIDLRLAEGHLQTAVASGVAHLDVDADWTAAIAWLTQPDLLFADVFPSTVKISGEIALLSLFEGALWRATNGPGPSTSPTLIRWSQLWPAGPARQALRATTSSR